MPRLEELSAQLGRLSDWDSGPFPVVSLYLNLQANDRGRNQFEPFLRKELTDRLATYNTGTPERESLDKDIEKIRDYVDTLDPAINGLALFSSSGADLFEAIPLAAPVPDHRLYVSNSPHLYPLARLIDEYPRYAVLLADTQAARIFVFAVNALEQEQRIQGIKTKHHKKGGMAQARYQRHAENYHLHHVREVTDTLARIVREEEIPSIVIAGDEVVVPLLREELPKDIAERVVDIVKVDMHASLRTVLETTIATMQEKDAATDRERVDALLDAYRGNGLGVVGVDRVRRALEMGQVDELIITARPETIDTPGGSQSEPAAERTVEEKTADELIAKARQTSASIRFIEDASLLQPVGGVGALLRFKL